MAEPNAFRHLDKINGTHSPFGTDRFGQTAEAFARYFGTPKFIIIQSCIVVVWILLNISFAFISWDKYPFILLNLMFSTQAAYAAPLILLAQTRQAERDKAHAEAAASHNQEESEMLKTLIKDNTNLTEQVANLVEVNTNLTEEIRTKVNKPKTTRRKRVDPYKE